MSRQLPRLTDSAPQIQHRPFWTRLPSWLLMVAAWVIVYVVTILVMRGF